MKNVKRFLGKNVCHICLFVCLFALVFGVRTLAHEAIIIADFADGTSGWAAGDNVTEIRCVQIMFEQDGKKYSRSCLEVVSDKIPSDSLRSVATIFSEPLDLGGYREVSFDICAPYIEEDPDAMLVVRITLVCASGEATEYLEVIEAGKWNNINANIGTLNGRTEVIAAEIALVADTSLAELDAYSFYIDDIVTSKAIDQEMIARFLFDEYSVEGGSHRVPGNKSKIVLTHNDGEAMMLDAQVLIPERLNESNRLCLRIANYTENDSFTLYYSTSDSQATTEDKSVEIEITPNSDARDYFVDVGDVGQLRRVKLMFKEGTGSVEIVSLSVVPFHSTYDYNACGRLISCKISADGNSITFSGEVGRDVSSANQSGFIGIYEFVGSEPPTPEKLASMTPLVKGTMATRFEMSWQLPKSSSYMMSSAFMAAVVGEDGEYRFICPPFYVENLDALASGSFEMQVDSKGFSSNDISAIGDADTGVTLIEIDVNKAFAQTKQPQMYAYRGGTYYFDGEYINEISSKIDILSKAGCDILLRLCWQGATYLDGVSDLASPEHLGAIDYIGAISSYAAKKWAHNGSVNGIIYGFGANTASKSESFTQNVERVARDLRSVYMNLIQVNATAKVYVSLTDKYNSEVKNTDTEFDLAIYLPALISETSLYTQFKWEIAIENVGRSEEALAANEFLSVKDCDSLRALLSEFGMSDTHMIFIDSSYAAPDAYRGVLISEYVVGTYTAKFTGDIDAYIAAAGDYAARISDAVRYIYTSEAYVVEDIVARLLGVDDMFAAVDGYDTRKIKSVRFSEAEASLTAPDNIKGKFNYYRFDSTAAIGGFYPSYYSSELRTVNDNGTVAAAQLGSVNGNGVSSPEWMGIANNLEIKENLRLTPTLAITLKIDSAIPSTVTDAMVKIVLKSDSERFESSVSIPVGEWTTVYVSTEKFSSARDTSKIEILAGGGKLTSAVLKVHSIDGLSREYNDESLTEVIEKARLERTSSEASFDFGVYLPIAIVVLVVVGTVITVALLGRKKNTSKD